MCVEIFTAEGYKCLVPDEDSSLVVEDPLVSAGELDDLIQFFIEQELVRRQYISSKPVPNDIISILYNPHRGASMHTISQNFSEGSDLLEHIGGLSVIRIIAMTVFQFEKRPLHECC